MISLHFVYKPDHPSSGGEPPKGGGRGDFWALALLVALGLVVAVPVSITVAAVVLGLKLG